MKLWKILGVELYEVGDLYLTMNNKNPGLRFKGTWELIAQGRTLVGVDTSQSEFNSARKSGGNQPHNNLQPYLTTYIWQRVS